MIERGRMTMSKRTRQCIGILFAIVAYYIIHEGAHLVMALMFHAFKKEKGTASFVNK